ncbi:ABC transporter type 1, transmembrane domain-containing protein [Mycena sp. CBHHK59/15]|nr:ABC transporter type 1, transmembrane domain-containing protein [Mycena sp. CBHHK59/15]
MKLVPWYLSSEKPMSRYQVFPSYAEIKELVNSGAPANSLSIPAVTSGVSAGLLCLNVFLTNRICNPPISTVSAKNYKNSGNTSPKYAMVRLSGCVVLLALSSLPLRDKLDNGSSEGLQIGLCLTDIGIRFKSSSSLLTVHQLYATLLALLSLFASPPFRDSTTRHLNVVLIASFGTYIYWDVLPLGTFTSVSQDAPDGPVLWIKIALLGLIGLAIPLATPREYIPADPLHPMPIPNPEQTASILSLAFYTFLNPTIFLAHRLTRLPYDLLPPLADYDSTRHLRSKSFPHLDAFSGAAPRHLFFGIVRVFRADIAMLTGTSAVIVLGKFVVPLGVNRLLRYNETNGAGASVRPWVWVLWLFLGPTVCSLSEQWYMYIVSRVVVRAETILMELIFEHALRIRMNETSAPAKKGPLLGKLNNMVTTDIRIILEAKSLLLSLVYMPLQLLLSVWFLYAVLGWSALIAMATIVALLPVPGYAGRWVQTAQRNLARKRDARVQSVTETVNLLCIIKFFGWEKKMSAEVAARRREELACLWTRRLLDLLNGCINILIPIVTMIATYATYVSAMKLELLHF